MNDLFTRINILDLIKQVYLDVTTWVLHYLAEVHSFTVR